jgi:head-tail adaptor
MAYKPKTYEPGRFDVPITIKQRVTTKNAYNEDVVSLVKFAEAWAMKVYGGGKEFYAGTSALKGSKVAQSTCMFTFRYVEGLNEKMVIVDEEGTFNITDISLMNRKQYHQVVAHADTV